MADIASDQEFHKVVGRTLRQLLEQIDIVEADGLDARLSPGNLQVQFDGGGTFILSQQTPTRELWLSANLRAWHFRWREGAWLERESGKAMTEVLSGLFTEAVGAPVVLSL